MSQLYFHTPLLLSQAMSRILGANVYLKLELLQPSGSFKNRGIGNFCAESAEQGAHEFVCSSRARQLCEERSATYVSPFDHPLIWKGNATIISEVKESGIKPDAVVLSVGEGGLLCGIVKGLHEAGWEDVPVYAVETEGAASFAAAMEAGKVVEIDTVDTVAKSLGARAVCEEAVRWSGKHKIHSKIVTDQAAVVACEKFAEDHRMLVEPACGAALSVCYGRDEDLHRYRNILVIVCGGACIS